MKAKTNIGSVLLDVIGFPFCPFLPSSLFSLFPFAFFLLCEDEMVVAIGGGDSPKKKPRFFFS